MSHPRRSLRRGEGRDAIEAIGCAAGGGVAAVARVRPDADEFGVGVLQGVKWQCVKTLYPW